VSFLGLAAIALLACALFWFAVPETLSNTAAATSTSASDSKSTTERERQNSKLGREEAEVGGAKSNP
jgi:hypothetical protein